MSGLRKVLFFFFFITSQCVLFLYFCAMFGRLVASHFIWDFLVLNRNCFAQCERWLFLSRCKLLRYFHVKQTNSSIFSFLCKLYFSSPCFCFAFFFSQSRIQGMQNQKGLSLVQLVFWEGTALRMYCQSFPPPVWIWHWVWILVLAVTLELALGREVWRCWDKLSHLRVSQNYLMHVVNSGTVLRVCQRVTVIMVAFSFVPYLAQQHGQRLKLEKGS